MNNDSERGGQSYQTCCATIQYTASEMKKLKENEKLFSGLTTWGRPNIEGRIICQQFGIKLHLIEFLEHEGKIIPNHVLVTADRQTNIEEKGIPNDQTVVHLAVFRNHYVPIYPKNRPESGLGFAAPRARA